MLTWSPTGFAGPKWGLVRYSMAPVDKMPAKVGGYDWSPRYVGVQIREFRRLPKGGRRRRKKIEWRV